MLRALRVYLPSYLGQNLDVLDNRLESGQQHVEFGDIFPPEIGHFCSGGVGLLVIELVLRAKKINI